MSANVEALPGLADVRAAAAALDGVARLTPVIADALLDERIGAEVHVKAEFLQRGGSFKFRGMYNRVRGLSRPELERGVVTASSGNAGLGLALAARVIGTSAVIVMPEGGSATKRARIEEVGGSVIEHGDSSDAMLEHALEIARRERRSFVHPFDQPEVIAGQGTVGLEIHRQLPALDAVLVPAGGGGLLAGTALALRALGSSVEIVGVEPEGADAIRRSLAVGRPVALPTVTTIAEGLAVRIPGALTFSLIERHVDSVVTVSDDAIRRAVALLWTTLHVAVEPSGAAALAALPALARLRGGRVAVVASGANIAPSMLFEAIDAATATRGAR